MQIYARFLQRLTPRARRYAERAYQAGLNLRTLIQSILDTRKLEQGAADFEPACVDVRAALDVALTHIDPREAKSGQRDLHVHLPEGTVIWGDAIRLQQILTNLLSNALKYSEPDTPISITAQEVRETPPGKRGPGQRMMEIAVRDYGLGVPPDKAPLLFQRFVRLPRDMVSTTLGNGLGLYLCRIYAEAMGGRIWVVSTGVPGEGSTFILRLPMPPEEPSAAIPEAATVAAEKARSL